ncbi:MAG: glutamate--tRNA ligase, partial [Candidatus Omnitrophica bacterium]|nr:glutamate--tRNA ligase [Candidatus Omnitrophota bacterium]
LRIEDTDISRSRKEYEEEILESLKWLGFYWDEIYYQSKRLDLYREYAEKLLKEEKAYLEESNKGRAIIFRVPQRRIKINDLIRGEIEFDTSNIKDQVLIKSDGTPTYNFACVIDDALLKITHVIRGDDHLSNTPKQVLLYEALGFSMPYFAHLPLIMGMQGGRLSKRTGATSISEYKKMGYLPEALVNYLLLLSWSPGDNREIISIEEAKALFDIKDVNKTPAAFDIKKLSWMNSQYIKSYDSEKLLDLLLPYLIQAGYTKEDFDRKNLISLVKLFQGRINTLADFLDWADYFFLEDINIPQELKDKFLNKDFSKEFSLFLDRLDKLEDFNILTIENTFRDLVRELNIQAKELIHPIRVALTGKTVGPGLFEIIYYLGKERTRKRLQKFIKKGEEEC